MCTCGKFAVCGAGFFRRGTRGPLRCTWEVSVGGKCNIQLATVCNAAELQRPDRAPRTLQDPPAPGPGPLIPDLGQREKQVLILAGARAKIRTYFFKSGSWPGRGPRSGLIFLSLDLGQGALAKIRTYFRFFFRANTGPRGRARQVRILPRAQGQDPDLKK